MASEVIKLNLIPKGEMPVFHASQFDTGRLITCELYRGEDAYSVPEGYTVELHCRKVDNNIVTMASTLINDNVVTFTSTEQLTACNGKNLCEVAILDDGYRIGTLNFILEVEVDPLKGGINSTSEIHNLETQVEEITTEIIGENYYNKTEVDDLLDTKADASSVYTKSETDTKLALKANAADVYTKTQTDTLLNAKADASDVYTKTQTDTLLNAKANASDVYTKTQTDTALATKADKSDTYTKEQVDDIIYNIFPVKTASGIIANFTTGLTYPLVSVTAAEGATTITRCGINLFDNTFSAIDNTVRYRNIRTGNGTFTMSTDAPIVEGAAILFFLAGNVSSGASTATNGVSNGTSRTVTTTDGYVTVAYRTYGTPTVSPANYDTQLEFGSQASIYQEYNGQTVPVADATTLTTLSGVNNVYADIGEVTVQYKYLSM